MKFYSVQAKENVEVSDDQVEIFTMKNGKRAARATIERGGKALKLVRIIGKKELETIHTQAGEQEKR